MRRILFALALISANLAGFTGPARAGERVAFFGFILIDTSLGTSSSEANSPEMQRIRMLNDVVAKRFADEGYTLVDIAPVQAQIDGIANPAKCYGCDTRAATELGADYSLVGEVQKVSNLILAMNLQMRDAKTGEMVKGRVVDIRGNTDESWRRGITYILDRTFFK